MSNEHFTKLVKNATSRRRWRERRAKAERTLKKRRKRYADDPLYADSIKESVKRQREARGPSDRKRSFNRDKIIILNGVSVTLYSSGKAAHLVGVSPRTLANWEKKGLIPINRAKDSLGRRWYPAGFVVFLAEQAAKRPKGRLDRWADWVKDSWTNHQLSAHPIPIVGDYIESNK
jgi:hypothetical protein